MGVLGEIFDFFIILELVFLISSAKLIWDRGKIMFIFHKV